MGYYPFRDFVRDYTNISPPRKPFGEYLAEILNDNIPGYSVRRFTKTDKAGKGLMLVRLRTTTGWHAGLVTELVLRKDALQLVLYNQQGREQMNIMLEDLLEFYEWQSTNGSYFVIADGKLVKEIPKMDSGGENANLISAKTEPPSAMVQ